MRPAAPAAPKPGEGGFGGYASACIPEPYQVLGLKLHPFCLGHYQLMQRFGCAFVQESAGQAGIEDLVLGVLICSMRPAEFLEFIAKPSYLLHVRRWGLKIGAWDIKKKCELFLAYLKQGWTEPPHIRKSGGEVSGDWVQNLKITLMARLNYTDAEILELPLSKLLAEYFKLAEADGVIQLLSPQDFEDMKRNEEALARLQHILQPNPQPGAN